MNEKRKLDLHTLDELAAEIARLRRGYEKIGGSWTLEQVCDHCVKPLHYLHEPVKTGDATADEKELQQFLAGMIAARGIPDGRPTPPGTDPAPDAGPEAIDRMLAGLTTLEAHPGSHVTFSRFGTITTDQFKQFMVVHTQHHLNFFKPAA